MHLWELAHERCDDGLEAHVKHLVRFVEDCVLDAVEVGHWGVVELEQVGETAWGCDHNVGATTELADLLAGGQPTEHICRHNAGGVAELHALVVDLHRQLSRRCDDQSKRRLAVHDARLSRVCGHALQDQAECRDQKPQGLPRPGLGNRDQVASGEGSRPADRLDDGRGLEAGLLEGALHGSVVGDVEGVGWRGSKSLHDGLSMSD